MNIDEYRIAKLICLTLLKTYTCRVDCEITLIHVVSK